MTDSTKPCCYDCLSGDVTVKVIDLLGFEHWFCAEDWAAHQELQERIGAILEDAMRNLERAARETPEKPGNPLVS